LAAPSSGPGCRARMSVGPGDPAGREDNPDKQASNPR
jgi:hypothetical protein